MKREHWIGLLIIALVVGMLIGYGVWGTQAAQLANLNSKVQQLTPENAELNRSSPRHPPTRRKAPKPGRSCWRPLGKQVLSTSGPDGLRVSFGAPPAFLPMVFEDCSALLVSHRLAER